MSDVKIFLLFSVLSPSFSSSHACVNSVVLNVKLDVSFGLLVIIMNVKHRLYSLFLFF